MTAVKRSSVSVAMLAGVLIASVIRAVEIRVLLPEKPSAPPVFSAELDVHGLLELIGDGRPVMLDAASGKPLATQIDIDGGVLYWRAPVAWQGVRRFRLSTETARKAASAADQKRVRVQETADAVVVETPWVRIIHRRRDNGGFPLNPFFKKAGVTDEHLLFNDRIYDRATRTVYNLRYDKTPEVRAASLGALGAVVEVRARYVSAQGRWPDSHPRACYRFFYRADSPAVEVTADVRQDVPRLWNELHFLEIHHKPLFFPKWTGGPQAKVHAFTPADRDVDPKRKRSAMCSDWGAIFGNGAAIALLVQGSVRFYDGAAGYGAYMHGPWISNWSGRRWRGRAFLYLGDDAGAPESFQTWVAAHRPLLKCRVAVEVPELDRLVRAARAAAVRPLQQWLLARVLRDLYAGRRVRAATGMLRRLAQNRAPTETLRTVLVGEGRSLVFDGKRLLLAFGPLAESANGGWGCVGMFDVQRGVELLQDPDEGLWTIRFAKPDGSDAVEVGTTSLGVRGPQVERDGDGAMTFVWPDCPLPDGARFDVRATVRRGLRGVRWSIAVRNHSTTFGIHSLHFPVLSGLDARTTPVDEDWIVYPEGWGVLVRSPQVYFHRRYPSGSCVMQFMLYGTDAGGLYLAAEDGRAFTKELWADATGPGTSRLALLHFPENMLRAGIDYTQPFDIVTRAYTGSWYDGARIYREWALKQKWASAGPVAQRKDVAERFKRIAVWVRTPAEPEEAVKAARAAREFFRVSTANHWYVWHKIRFDDDYPNYFPPKDGFKQAVAEMNRMRVWPMPYINGRLWDTDTDNFQTTGRKYCTKNERGEPYIEVYGSGEKLAAMCPATRVWQDTIGDIVWRLVDEYGVAGVYIDQVGAAAPRLCMDPGHGHPLGGGDWWVRGYEAMLSRLRARIKKAHPDAFLTTESNAEPYMRFFDGYLMCNSTRPDLIPLFSAVYHDWILTFGRYAFPSDLERHPDAFYTKIGQLFAFGAQMGWISTAILHDKYRDGAEYLRRLSVVRARSLPWLGFGEQLRPLRFSPEPPAVHTMWRRFRQETPVTLSAVQHSVWRAADGSLAIALTNVSRAAVTAAWSIVAKEYGLPEGSIAITQITPEGEAPDGVADGPVLHFSLPLKPHDACVLVLRSAVKAKP